ncbi:MAG: hypothetical protein HOP29_04305 [Phycisphaerales bacterium]|nr:hypothetical protein [Phycisphaerales bacterium]
MGLVALPANAQAGQIVLTGGFGIPALRWIGGGDAEVNTKDGRATDAYLWVGNERIVGATLQFDVYYWVQEVWSDYSTLEGRLTVSVPIPPGYRFASVARSSPVRVWSRFGGRDHSWHSAWSNNFSTSFRFDGNGKDNAGNAAVRGTFSIAVNVW